MNLYLLKRTDGEETYDEYHGAVIAAMSIGQAKAIMIGLDKENRSFSWDCTLISTTTERGISFGVILSDYYDG